MKTLNLIVAAFFLFNFCYAQHHSLGPRFAALGNTGVALQDIWSLQSNQAGLAGLRRPAAAVSYESRFSGTGISTQSALVAIPYRHNVFGVSAESYGIPEYQEQRAGLAYARSFGKKMFASLNFNLYQLKIPGYGNTSTWSVEAGMQYRLADGLIIGTHISNPNEGSYSPEAGSSVPSKFECGAAWQCSETLLLNAGLVKEADYSSDVRCGIEYSPSALFFLRGGVATVPFRHFAGFGCVYRSLRIDMAVASHQYLGYSPQLGLHYEF